MKIEEIVGSISNAVERLKTGLQTNRGFNRISDKPSKRPLDLLVGFKPTEGMRIARHL